MGESRVQTTRCGSTFLGQASSTAAASLMRVPEVSDFTGDLHSTSCHRGDTLVSGVDCGDGCRCGGERRGCVSMQRQSSRTVESRLGMEPQRMLSLVSLIVRGVKQENGPFSPASLSSASKGQGSAASSKSTVWWRPTRGSQACCPITLVTQESTRLLSREPAQKGFLAHSYSAKRSFPSRPVLDQGKNPVVRRIYRKLNGCSITTNHELQNKDEKPSGGSFFISPSSQKATWICSELAVHFSAMAGLKTVRLQELRQKSTKKL
ncbi:hypothetical protein B0J18DRAFT_154737 [Chaetomium sp. MPI-SDFR-AT-0129]|nr:hypothetical protein B0J18DRAFT_154737 [Chaetomium sp. MPI-SDFR-AT-0129]